MSISIRRILVPLDLSPASERVASYAVEMGRCFKAEVTVLHVVEGTEELKGLNLPHISYDELLPDLETQGRERLERFAARHLEKIVGARLRVVAGHPHECILEEAKASQADLIVLGSQGRRGLARALFGSTAERVMRSSPVPVVVVPVGEEPA